MRTIVVDDEPWMLQRFTQECGHIPDVQLLGSFRNHLKALDYARENRVELAFLDVEMPELNGLQLAGKLREISPEIIIIFVSAYESYMAEAFRTKTADYYIMKPYNTEDVEAAIDRARLLSGRLRKKVSARTFGPFELFMEQTPVCFPDPASKALLALHIDRCGGIVTQADACETLWGSTDEETAMEYRRALRQLQDTLKEAKLDGIIGQNAQGAFLHRDVLDCDLYQYMDGELKSMRQFAGEYMTGYGWAAHTRQSLIRQKELLSQYSDSLTRNTLCASIRNLNDQALTLTYVNEGFLAITGYTRDELEERFHNSLRALILRDDFDRAVSEGKRQLREKGRAEVEYRLVSKNGDEIWVLGKCEAAAWPEDGAPFELACMLMDISAVKAEQQRLELAAQHDLLTGLLNRGTAQEKIRLYLKEHSEDYSALILMDVDNFKAVNDTYGHPFADTVLTDIAAIFRRTFRANDILCRLGGDEMMLFLKGVKKEALAREKLAEAREALSRRLRAKTEKGELSCSFGGVLYPEDGTDFDTLYQRADLALYAAKEKKDCAVWFSQIRMQVVDKLIAREVTAIEYAGRDNAFPSAPEGMLQRLEGARDLFQEIDGILRMIGQRYDISRVYIFEITEDGKYAVNTFEWCAYGIEPQIENLRQLPAGLLSPYYQMLFENDGLFYCYDVRNLDAPLYEVLAPQGIKSVLQCALAVNGTSCGMVGFDECRQRRYWSGRQIKILHDFSKVIGRVLYQYREAHGRTLAALQAEHE